MLVQSVFALCCWAHRHTCTNCWCACDTHTHTQTPLR